MPLIQKIERVKGFGVFDGFSWATSVEPFHARNLIYGLNGSGKTTLARILRCVETKSCSAGEFQLVIDDRDVSSAAMSNNAHLPRLKVFNTDFIDTCVFTPTQTTLPIFFLGQESAAQRKRLDDLAKSRAQVQDAMQAAELAESRAGRELDQLNIDSAATIKELLRSPGANPFNTYDKRSFARRCDQLLAHDTKPTVLSDAEIAQYKNILAATQKPVIEEVRCGDTDFASLYAEVTSIGARRVVADVIDSLRNRPELNAWIAEGLHLHESVGQDTCEFCQSPLPRERLAELHRHFSNEWRSLLDAIAMTRLRIDTEVRLLRSLSIPDSARLYDDQSPSYRLAADDVVAAKEALVQFLIRCDGVLQAKAARPFDSVEVQLSIPNALELRRLNNLIGAHNARTADFDGERILARDALEENVIATVADRRMTFVKEHAASKIRVAELRGELRVIDKEIAELDRAIREHRRPAEQINVDLANYLGRTDITLEVDDAGYKIMRAGERASRLSEGERTALALVYFLKSLEDRSFDSDHGVVVIDDPVSSLDANALFYAFSFIQQRTQSVAQLFILTHNFGFLRLVRKWFHRLNRKKEKSRTGQHAEMYMLCCRSVEGKRHAVLEPLDPLLKEYDSEYHYLYAEVVRGSQRTTGSLDGFYQFPNIARRLLESFLAFRLPDSGSRSDMHEFLHKLQYDFAKTNRILNFLNVHSHSRHPDGNDEHDDSILMETPAVLSDVLGLIEHADPGHSAEMKALVARHTCTA